VSIIATSLNILLREDKINAMDYLIVVCTVSIISLIAFTYLPVTNTTAKVNATPNTTLHKDGVPKPSEDFLIPYYKGMAYLNAGNYTEAIPYFDKALVINPNYTLALNNKGAALYGLGIYNESIAYFDKALSVNPYYSTALYNKGAALSKLGIYNESIAYFDKVLAIQPTNALALAGKELDFAAFSKTKIIAKPTGAIATPQNPQASDFGYYIQKRATAPAPAPAPPPPPPYPTNTHTQKPILTCDQSGHPSCYSIGYSKGLLNTQTSCSATTLNSFVIANPSQVNNFCSGYRVAAQQALQQQR
jgi:tetratricopeptide (TPR) repeat protein